MSSSTTCFVEALESRLQLSGSVGGSVLLPLDTQTPPPVDGPSGPPVLPPPGGTGGTGTGGTPSGPGLPLPGGSGKPVFLTKPLADAEVAVIDTLPSTAVAGTKIKSKALVSITNQDTGASGGLVTIRLDISPTQTASGAIALTTVTKSLRLKQGQTKSINFTVPALPASLAEGTYTLVAELIDSGSNTKTAAATNTTSVAAAFVDLSAAFASVPAVLTAGHRESATLTLNNLGNTSASGRLTVEFSARPIGTTGADVALATMTKRVRLSPSAGKTLKLAFAVPASLPSGTYMLVAQIDPANTFGDSDLSNNIAVG